ncbi:unnamed protein product, partial [Mesorhabditis belari]|uniref:Uncharacterized protein n=1 Tax=Mesorhabditis belari TaxID=2138241 RepID=A0AAF3EVK3_9BILA
MLLYPQTFFGRDENQTENEETKNHLENFISLAQRRARLVATCPLFGECLLIFCSLFTSLKCSLTGHHGTTGGIETHRARAMLDAGVISIKKVRVAVVGDKGVGKTSLIRAFTKDPENSVEEAEATRMFYVDEQRYLFTLIELHDNWDKDEGHRFGIEAVLLCYDGEREQEKRLAEKWTPKITERFPAAKVYLVRTKCDRLYENFDDSHSPADVAQMLHVVKGYECSAKEHTGIEKMFKKLAQAHTIAHPEDHGKLQRVNSSEVVPVDNQQRTSTCGLATTVFSALRSSIPLVKQAGHNLKEIAWNPDCFPATKNTIHSYIPFLFYTRPSYDYKRIGEEHKLHEDYLVQVKQEQHEQEQKTNNSAHSSVTGSFSSTSVTAESNAKVYATAKSTWKTGQVTTASTSNGASKT